MEKIETGMYVRTTNGISKVDDINDVREITWYGSEKPLKNVYLINKGYIIKASYNIIDLIEEGDYVNGEPVIGGEKFKDGSIYLIFSEDRYIKRLSDIETIVTQEQFENMKYEVK